MRNTIAACLLLFLTLLTDVTAIPDDHTVGFKYKKTLVPKKEETSSVLRKRQDGTITTEISNFGIIYLINVTVGSPPQDFSLILDTGSSDLWIASIDSDICEYDIRYCAYGAFNYNDSSTFVVNEDWNYFYIEYVDGTAVQGVYFNDTLAIDDVQIEGASMALALSANSALGVMGIAFTENESSNSPSRVDLGLGEPFTYPTILDNLVSQGHIQSRSYALWLDDLADDTGTILFGGVDTEKYIGDLVSLPIQDDTYSGSKSSFTVAWSGLSVNTGEDGASPLDFSPSEALPAILDSGTSLSYLPDEIVESLYNGVGVITDPQAGNVVPCTINANNYTFTFTFGGEGGASITVPLSELLFPLIDSYTEEPYTGTNDASDPQLCQFGIEKAGSNPFLLGDTFLRSAYVVYDLDNFQIALAQTNFEATASTDGDEVTPISGTNGIPDVASTASAASVVQTFSGNPLITADGPDASGTAVATAQFGDYGTETVSRSATFTFSESGTLAPTDASYAGSQSSSSRASSSASRSGSGSGSGSATGSAAQATASNGAGDFGANWGLLSFLAAALML